MYSNKIMSIDELWQFFNFSTSLYAIAGPDGYLRHINPSLSNLLEYTEKEFLGTSYLDFVHPDDRDLTLQKLEELHYSKSLIFSNRCLTKSGTHKYLSWTLTYSDKYDMIYANAQDHTERYLLEEELEREKEDKQKRILEATTKGQELERVSVGRELHDNINQLLTSVSLYMEMAILHEGMREVVLTKAREIQLKAINEIRALSKAMIAPQVGEIGLVESVEELTNTIRVKDGLNIDFQHDGFSEAIPAKVKLMLFRIIQEQTTNIIKYARAANVCILLSIAGEYLKLVIQDDGVGFDPTEKRKGIGLRNIISRTEIYNGTVEIKSAPNKGCRISVNIPLCEVFDNQMDATPLPGEARALVNDK